MHGNSKRIYLEGCSLFKRRAKKGTGEFLLSGNKKYKTRVKGLGGHNGGGNPLTQFRFFKKHFFKPENERYEAGNQIALPPRQGVRNKDLFSFHRQNKHCQPDRPDYCEGHHACPGC
jgi:hypothetical protein